MEPTGTEPLARPANRDVLSLPVLLLNRHFAPVTVATAKRAFCLLYGGAAHAVDQEGDTYEFGDWVNLPVRQEDDGLPIIGPSLLAPGAYHAFGFSAHGFQLGPAVGEVLADLAIHGASRIAIDAFSVGRATCSAAA